MALRIGEDFEAGVAFLRERLQWYDFVTEDRIGQWEDWAWAVVDHELLLARSALELVRERLPEDALAEMAAADAQWRAHPQAFEAMFGRFVRWLDASTALAGWVEDEAGRPIPIPAQHWWWRLPKDW